MCVRVFCETGPPLTAAALWFLYRVYHTCRYSCQPLLLSLMLWTHHNVVDTCSGFYQCLSITSVGACKLPAGPERSGANSKVKLKEEVDCCLTCRGKRREVINVSHRANYSSVTETSSHLLSLPAPFFHCVAIGYSMFSHGSLNRALDMKSPPPLNLGSDGLRGDAAMQSAGVTRVNHSSAVSGCCSPVCVVVLSTFHVAFQ